MAGLLLLPNTALAWHATGHMVVARIAYSRLTSKARQEADRLLQLAVNPAGSAQNSDFVTAACWADDIKNVSRTYNSWHYLDIPYSPERLTTPPSPKENNVVWAIREQTKILKDSVAADSDRAKALRFLIHFVGDVHQPLHSSTRYTKALPDGDQGGNKFPLSVGNYHNLHAYWDGALGMYPDLARPLDADGEKTLKALAEEATAAYSDRKPEWKNANPQIWAEESSQAARRYVYALQENAMPSAEYNRRGQNLVRIRIAMAGYRLAALLNTALDR